MLLPSLADALPLSLARADALPLVSLEAPPLMPTAEGAAAASLWLAVVVARADVAGGAPPHAGG